MKIIKNGIPEKILQPLRWMGAATTVHCVCEADLILKKGDWVLKEDGVSNKSNKKYVISCLFCKRHIVKSQAALDAA